MKEFQIETAQNVSINQNVANVSTRIGSFLLDMLIIVGYVIIMMWILKDYSLVLRDMQNLT